MNKGENMRRCIVCFRQEKECLWDEEWAGGYQGERLHKQAVG